MKRLLLFFCGLFLYTICWADTVNLTWMDGDTTHTKTTCTIGGDLNVPATQPTKYGYDFVGWRVKAAKELEYVTFQGVGNSSIDTGVMFDSDEIEYETKLSFSTVYKIAFGAEGTCSSTTITSNSAGSISLHGTHEGLNFRVGKRHLVTQITRGSINTYSLYINKRTNDITAKANDIILNSTINGVVTTDKNIFLGGTNTDAAGCDFGGNIYYFKIKKDGVLVRDLVPVLDPDGVVCFYDKVTKEFFYNRNGPSLIAGPVIE